MKGICQDPQRKRCRFFGCVAIASPPVKYVGSQDFFILSFSVAMMHWRRLVIFSGILAVAQRKKHGTTAFASAT
jgi:hypothetical protein